MICFLIILSIFVNNTDSVSKKTQKPVISTIKDTNNKLDTILIKLKKIQHERKQISNTRKK